MGFRIATAVTAAFILGGCASSAPPVPETEPISREVEQAQGQAPEARPGRRAEGSIWRKGQSEVFADAKAHQVGDIITVNLQESAQGSNSADTDVSRSSSNAASMGAFLGAEQVLGDSVNEFSPETSVDTSTDTSTQGEGETNRSANLTGNMTAVVVKAFPNGNMRIRGSRQVAINNEEQVLVLSGIIRPQDIRSDNSIPSSLIANADISYAGRGVVARQQGEGWGTKFLHAVWPF